MEQVRALMPPNPLARLEVRCLPAQHPPGVLEVPLVGLETVVLAAWGWPSSIPVL